MSGTARCLSAGVSFSRRFLRVSILLIRVRTELIKLIIFAFTLVLSCIPPNAGSCCEDPHPTLWGFAYVSCDSALVGQGKGVGRTAGEESVFGEDGYGVDEQYRDWKGGLLVYAVPPPSQGVWRSSFLPWNRPPKEKNRVAMLQERAQENWSFPDYFAVLLIKSGEVGNAGSNGRLTSQVRYLASTAPHVRPINFRFSRSLFTTYITLLWVPP